MNNLKVSSIYLADNGTWNILNLKRDEHLISTYKNFITDHV